MPRGRPKTDGHKPGWMLYRASVILAVYARINVGKIGRNTAIARTVSHVQANFPGMPISATEVKKALNELQPEKKSSVFIAEQVGNKITLSVGTRPEYGKRGIQKTRVKINFASGEKKA